MVDGKEEDTDEERGACQTNKHPHDGWVEGSGRQGFGDGRSEGVGEQIHRLHERLHGWWCLGVGVLETGHRGENLGNTDEEVGGCLDGDVDVVSLRLTIDNRSIAPGGFVTWPGGVDEVLDNSSVHHGQRSDDKTERDTRDRAEPNAQATEHGVHQGFQDRDEHDNGDRVEVLHQIVWNTVPLHLTSLSDKVAGELAVNDPVNGIEAEYAASNKSTLKLINKVVVPGNMGSVATILGLPSGLGGVHVAVDDHDPESLESVGDDRSLRRTDDVELAPANDNSSTNCKHAQAEQVSRPKSNIPLHVRCS